MEKIGDYIPLIIIALSFIYTIVRKAGKKATEEEEVTGKTTLPTVDWPWSEVDVAPEPQIEFQSQKLSSAQAKKKKQPEISTSFSNRERQSSILPDEITENTGISIDFSDIDELKKGIIYSEIFNRKY